MALASFAIIAIILIKYKPVYSVTIAGQKMGYVSNKVKFENEIENKILHKQEENVAFVTVNDMPQYEFKFVSDEKVTNEEEILSAMEQQSTTTYVTYAVTLDNEVKASVSTMEEAQQVVDEIKEEFNQDLDLNLSIEQKFSENKEELNLVEMQIAKTNLDTEIQEIVAEKKEKEERTVNGIFLAVQPISGSITSRYGSISSLRSGAHTGLDIAAPKGTEIKAVASGEVILSRSNGAYGNMIQIDHGNGIQTWYGHCTKLYAQVGEWVEAGEVIATVGSTGNSTGNHLHLEVRIDGVAVNPQQYLYK